MAAVVFWDFIGFAYALWFVGLQSLLMFGLFLEWRRDRRLCALASEKAGGNLPRVSVVIPVHDEEHRIAPLLRSLSLQEYPQAEYIFIDDRSGDKSPELLARFAETGKPVRIITLAENPGPNHKQFALGRGIEAASGEYFLFTDADCEVPPGWIAAMVRRMADEGIGAAIAPVFKKKERPGFFPSYQCYDHIVRYVYLAGAAGLGAAGGGFGNNLILRRACLEAAGGYDAVPPSPTEDAALISQIRSTTAYRVHSAVGRDTHVLTRPEPSWRTFINQTLRWNNGGLFSPETITRLNYTVLMLTIASGILVIPLLPLFPRLWPMPLGVFIVMLENTAGALLIARGRFPENAHLESPGSLPPSGLGWVPELVFMPFYMTLMTVMGYLGIKTDWKGSGMKEI